MFQRLQIVTPPKLKYENKLPRIKCLEIYLEWEARPEIAPLDVNEPCIGGFLTTVLTPRDTVFHVCPGNILVVDCTARTFRSAFMR